MAARWYCRCSCRRLLELGARAARPGEFSERAFLNDKLDLAQAEAIADLIASGTEASARAAQRSLEGALSRRVNDAAGRADRAAGVHRSGAGFSRTRKSTSSPKAMS